MRGRGLLTFQEAHTGGELRIWRTSGDELETPVTDPVSCEKNHQLTSVGVVSGTFRVQWTSPLSSLSRPRWNERKRANACFLFWAAPVHIGASRDESAGGESVR